MLIASSASQFSLSHCSQTFVNTSVHQNQTEVGLIVRPNLSVNKQADPSIWHTRFRLGLEAFLSLIILVQPLTS